ncbi:MAG: ABC transporter permease [Planctomycetia bacterium]|nr:ABC transporter permease [Planctomycetia bacterium]
MISALSIAREREDGTFEQLRMTPFAPWEVLLAALLITFLSASISLGLFISSLTQNLQQSLLGIFIVIVPFALLSGMATPVESMPTLFQKAVVINPLRRGIEALPCIFPEGATFRELRHVFLFLASIALGAATIAFVAFSKQR